MLVRAPRRLQMADRRLAALKVVAGAVFLVLLIGTLIGGTRGDAPGESHRVSPESTLKPRPTPAVTPADAHEVVQPFSEEGTQGQPTAIESPSSAEPQQVQRGERSAVPADGDPQPVPRPDNQVDQNPDSRSYTDRSEYPPCPPPGESPGPPPVGPPDPHGDNVCIAAPSNDVADPIGKEPAPPPGP